ncbi:MAG TPA: SDR family oxidoreductase [Bdellovibrionales bacterium]|nr:SDR family oxidoreductase [Bdellovibrionales bacterium]
MEILISGASTGIGRASAIHMARLDHSVWAGVRTQKSFDEISRLNVRGLHPVFLDVCDEASIVACLRLIGKEAGILHALVNNAGIAVGGPVEGVPLQDWRRQFEVNLFGQIRVIQAALPMLRESKGRIVNLSSISGKVAAPFLGPYAASKYAFEAVSDSLRRELAPLGVSVSVVEPGPIRTPIWDKGLADIRVDTAETEAVYGGRVARFMKRLEQNAAAAAPVSVVVETIAEALTSARPRPRYPVGRGISLAIALTRALPDRWLDRLISSKST